MRLIDADVLKSDLDSADNAGTIAGYVYKVIADVIDNAPTVKAVEVVKCKNCAHRPILQEIQRNIYHVVAPDDICPFGRVEDYIQIMPEDDFYCANGERMMDHETNGKENTNNEPTIDAIPIDTLKAWMYEAGEEDDIKMILAIDMIIKRWEREQEENDGV